MAAPPVVSPGPPVGATPVAAAPPPPPPAPVSTRAIRPNKGFACVAIYTICFVAVLEFFAWLGFIGANPLIGPGSGICWIACLISLVSVGWFHKVMNLVSLGCRVAALVLSSILCIVCALLVTGYLGVFVVTGGVATTITGLAVVYSVYGVSVFLINAMHIGLHAYLAYWINKGCPGATPPAPQPVIVAAPPVVVATPQPVMVAQPQVVVAQPMY